jgi:hypothetical protein
MWRKIMPASVIPAPLLQELCAVHVLAMQCGARASGFLDRAAAAGPAGWDERTNREAVRMATLASRLMEGFQRAVPRLRGRGVAELARIAVSSDPAVSAVRPAVPSAPRCRAAQGQRRGCLKNGNPSGDYLQAPRCGARTRAGCPCRQPAMANGRCRLHGGKSTGPRTPEGLARSRAARLVHGYRTRELIGLRSRAALAARRLRCLTRGLSAGHGVDRSDSRRRKTDDRGRIGFRRNAGPKPSVDRPFWHMSSVVCPQPAGHGVHRSDSGAQRADDGWPGRTFCHLFSVACPLPAGHGLHRSYRDLLRSSVAAMHEISP